MRTPMSRVIPIAIPAISPICTYIYSFIHLLDLLINYNLLGELKPCFLTALLSVATPEMTNINRNDAMNSITRDCRWDPVGVVPKKDSLSTSSIITNVPLAKTAPNDCANM